MLLNMNYAQQKKNLERLYISIPSHFHDEDLSINEDGIPEWISIKTGWSWSWDYSKR